MTACTVIVVDDHAIVRRGILETFAEAEGFEVAGSGGSAQEALALAAAHAPALVTLDVTMPGGGVEAARAIRAAYPATKIVMLSVREDPSTAHAAFAAGADAYVVKGVDGAQLIVAARIVLAGGRYVDPAVAAGLAAIAGGISGRDP